MKTTKQQVPMLQQISQQKNGAKTNNSVEKKIILMQKGTRNKVKAGNVESFNNFLQEIDEDRRNHRHYSRALERFEKYDQIHNALKIIVNCDKNELIKEAKDRFKESITDIRHKVNETTSDIHAAYALRTLIENSIDADL